VVPGRKSVKLPVLQKAYTEVPCRYFHGPV
jgi:hypothetical protein